MGTDSNSRGQQTAAPAGIADALFLSVQRRVLGYLFGQPDRSFFATELIKLVGGGSGAVQRELARLSRSGLVTVTRIGNQKHYQANPESPIFAELCGIAQKTIGLADPLRDAMSPLADRIDTAFIYGSIAKGADTANSDIDLLVISEDVSYPEVYERLHETERALGRKINPTLMTPREWHERRANGNSFVMNVERGPKILLLGTDENLT